MSDDRRAQLLLGRLGRILQASTNEVYGGHADTLRFEDANTAALEASAIRWRSYGS
ncbi:MAG: hypothetical protein U5Q44_10800 [Dehalococcoidia bacterium]|nr:hypothetical protein [Dehalococcoidia bacterium]